MRLHATDDQSYSPGRPAAVNGRSAGLSWVTITLFVLGLVVVLGMVAVVAGFGISLLKGQSDQTKGDVAHAQTKVIEAATLRFFFQNEEYPSSPEQLTRPDPNNNDKAYLSPNEIVDPWGQTFQIDPNGPHHDGQQPDVYTTSPAGKVIGNW